MRKKSGKNPRDTDPTSGNAFSSLVVLAVMVGELTAKEAVAVLGAAALTCAIRRR